MQPSKFDELTKALASSTSRRDALKTIVTASVGTLLGLGGVRSAFGNKIKCGGNTSNSDCAHWCAAVFGPNTSAAGRCTSDAAHGTGLCCQCGNVAPSSICCVRNNGFCKGGSPARCPCSAGQTCTSGTCCNDANACGSTCLTAPCSDSCATCDTGSGTCVCPSGTVQTSNGTCAQPCPNGGSDCDSGRCINTDEGKFCSTAVFGFGCNNTNLDCPAGSLCSGAVCERAC